MTAEPAEEASFVFLSRKQIISSDSYLMEGKMRILILCLCFLLYISPAASDVACKDHSGNLVEWFIAYKIPKLKGADPVTAAGMTFYYMDVNTPIWHKSPYPINVTSQPIAETIAQIYGNKAVMHIIYNDEKPDGTVSFTHGHTKGVVAFGSKTGFWLVHSVPRFPGEEKYDYPPTGEEYGQTFICITLPTDDNMDNVFDQLLITYPYIYSFNVPQAFSTNVKLKSILAGERNKTRNGNLVSLKASRGTDFYSFAKSTEYGQDLYSAWMSPWLKSSILAETWMKGPKPLPSTCGDQYPVKNIRANYFGGKLEFKETSDHAKWAVAENVPWTCIGDINRMKSQEQRCGGMICFQHADVNDCFKKIIKEADKCPPRHVPKVGRIKYEQL